MLPEEVEMYNGFAKAILEKYADPILKKLSSTVKDEWEKFKIAFDISFSEYLRKSTRKYGYIKTVLYRTEPKYLYDFFECPDYSKSDFCRYSGKNINDLLDVSQYLIVRGTGGIGKSTFLKHLFLDEINRHDFIPVFIELKELNSVEDEYDIVEFIFRNLNNLGSTIKLEYMDYALQCGCFVFLLDGYDEIVSAKKDIFIRKLDALCDKYSNNFFIMTSRACSDFVEFQRFTLLDLCELSKQQAINLIKKIEFDQDIKERFIISLDKELFAKHRSFASNPLLLSIMLLTFDNYAEIPDKLHLFYSNAFDTMYFKHDATKAGFHREMRCKLSYDLFKRVFSYFCFISYFQGKLEFDYSLLINILSSIKKFTVEFSPEDYIYDLINSICVLFRDGFNYKFTHRSFQEFFTAIFLTELADCDMKEKACALIEKDPHRAYSDQVFRMLRDMAPQRFENNVLIPMIEKVEQECDNEDRYDFYFKRISPEFCFHRRNGMLELGLALNTGGDERTLFLYNFAWLYMEYSKEKCNEWQESEEKLFQYLEKKYDKSIHNGFYDDEVYSDPNVYELLKKTWIGERIFVLMNLRESLSNKKKEIELNLDSLLTV